MARILVLSLVFPPDNVSTAHLMGELSGDLASYGHDVTVVTTVPHYNEDAVAAKKQPLSPHWGRLVRRSSYRGVPVYHIAMPRKSQSIPLRLAAWAGFTGLSVVAAARLVSPPPDVILAPSPPLTLGLSAWVLGALSRAPFAYNVQEMYPDVAINLGVLRNRVAIEALYGLERFVYDRAAAVTVIGPRMAARLTEKGVPVGKIHVIPNFVDVGALAPVPKDNAFAREWGLSEHFVVSYAGNMGPAQGLDCMLDAAATLRDNAKIRFLFVGSGTGLPLLKRVAAKRGLGNVTFVSHQPYARVPEIYGASDLCVVAQGTQSGSDALPSKVYRIMAAGRPILAATDERSDLAGLVRAADCGEVIPAASPRDFARVVLQAFHDQPAWGAMGLRGREYVVEHFAQRVITRAYADLVAVLAQRTDAVF